MKSAIRVPGFGTQSDLPVKTVTICVPVHAPGLKNSHFPGFVCHLRAPIVPKPVRLRMGKTRFHSD